MKKNGPSKTKRAGGKASPAGEEAKFLARYRLED